MNLVGFYYTTKCGGNILKGFDASYLMDRETAVRLVKYLCKEYKLENIDLGNGFFLIPPKGLDQGFAILLDENRISVGKGEQIIQDLKQLGFTTSIWMKEDMSFLKISLDSNQINVD
jgi:hypothetical protein